jgi:hypothetical protein
MNRLSSEDNCMLTSTASTLMHYVQPENEKLGCPSQFNDKKWKNLIRIYDKV